MSKCKRILIHFAWLVLALIMSGLIILLFCKWNFQHHQITVRILRTRVVFTEIRFLLSTWLLVNCIVFSIRELRINQNNIMGKVTAIITGVLFIISLSYLDAGWTSYPPLEALGAKQLTVGIFNRGIFTLQIITGFLLVMLLFSWIRKPESQRA